MVPGRKLRGILSHNAIRLLRSGENLFQSRSWLNLLNFSGLCAVAANSCFKRLPEEILNNKFYLKLSNGVELTHYYYQYFLGDYQVPSTCPKFIKNFKKTWWINYSVQKVLKTVFHWGHPITYLFVKQLCALWYKFPWKLINVGSDFRHSFRPFSILVSRFFAKG